MIEKRRPEPRTNVFDMQRRDIATENLLQGLASELRTRTGMPVADQPVVSSMEALLLPDRTDWLALFDRALDWQALATVMSPLAEIFAAIHTAEPDYDLEPARLEVFPTWPVEAERWHLLSTGLEELLAHVHSLGIAEELRRTAEELAAGDAFVHGDAKPDNVLVEPNRNFVRLIDWENAGLARPEADFSSLLGGLLYQTVAAPSYGRKKIPWSVIGEHGRAALQAAKALLHHYGHITGHCPDARLIARGSGLSLLCRAFVHVESTGAFDRIPRLLVKTSSRLLWHPELLDRWLTVSSKGL
ncbi:hypothetical protein RxyAA322_13020 [Rubrobacter xylanophilus]|uniref:Aminoglycoside phosphotransferase domain-containing protein n=1 Tax=Rubrobacter xylanophilus TaxID=49319 RepID=A0A510HHR1_9ACTN|nr:phosphotransferase [Rubrobacter xylanophilus]BBL79448.1 hypothetical protein RxyAA322_13020 [Rubrobacter xylanophilus]